MFKKKLANNNLKKLTKIYIENVSNRPKGIQTGQTNQDTRK